MNKYLLLGLAVISGCAATVHPTAGLTERAVIEASLKRDPNRGDLWRDLGWIDLLDGDAKRAGEEIERAAKLSPNDPRVLLGRAALLHTSGKIGEAREQWVAILERSEARDPW